MTISSRDTTVFFWIRSYFKKDDHILEGYDSFFPDMVVFQKRRPYPRGIRRFFSGYGRISKKTTISSRDTTVFFRIRSYFKKDDHILEEYDRFCLDAIVFFQNTIVASRATTVFLWIRSIFLKTRPILEGYDRFLWDTPIERSTSGILTMVRSGLARVPSLVRRGSRAAAGWSVQSGEATLFMPAKRSLCISTGRF